MQFDGKTKTFRWIFNINLKCYLSYVRHQKNKVLRRISVDSLLLALYFIDVH